MFDFQATEHLNAFIQDCDRRTELAKKRLAETQAELSAEVSSKAEKVHELAESIGKKLAQAEQAGAEGKVEESMKFMEEVEDIRKKKMSAELEYRNSMPASSYQQQKLRVCEVCSAYLGIHDNDRRLADHFGGKLHLGFIKIREKLDALLVRIQNFLSQKIFQKNNIFCQGGTFFSKSALFIFFFSITENMECPVSRLFSEKNIKCKIITRWNFFDRYYEKHVFGFFVSVK